MMIQEGNICLICSCKFIYFSILLDRMRKDLLLQIYYAVKTNYFKINIMLFLSFPLSFSYLYEVSIGMLFSFLVSCLSPCFLASSIFLMPSILFLQHFTERFSNSLQVHFPSLNVSMQIYSLSIQYESIITQQADMHYSQRFKYYSQTPML